MSSCKVRSLRACWRLLIVAVIVKEKVEKEELLKLPGEECRVGIAPNYITDLYNTSRRKAQLLMKVVQVSSRSCRVV
jgi:hypothetical protein